jgi:outer membrane protein assembly factor BamB
MIVKIKTLIIVILLFSCWKTSVGNGWHQFRADAARSGYTTNHLPARLKIGWLRKADSPPQPAWSGRDTRMPFDLAFQPVVSSGLVFYGSSSDCAIHALDAETGHEKWTYITDGPVRSGKNAADQTRKWCLGTTV